MWGTHYDRSHPQPHLQSHPQSHPQPHPQPVPPSVPPSQHHVNPYGPHHGIPLHGHVMGRGYEVPRSHPLFTTPGEVPNRSIDPYQPRQVYHQPHTSRYGYNYSKPPPYSSHFQASQGLPQERSYYRSDALPPGDDSSRYTAMVGGCTCKKSKCLKLYCQCFSSSTTCGPKCKCQVCHNTSLHRGEIDEARKLILERNPSAFEIKSVPALPPPESPTKSGCKCRRSFCLKKYCECFNLGSKCSSACGCVNCKNQPNGSDEQPLSGPYTEAQTTKLTRVSEKFQRLDSPPREHAPDHLAIMAAVAMTELCGTKRRVSNDTEIDRASKRIKVSDKGDEKPIVSCSSSSNSSSPETIRVSPQPSPVRMPLYPSQCYPYTAIHPMTFRPKAYEETTRLSGLPKSLSFRKICSKCGKTRSEHGELGFGHRCVYQDCGRCGAGIQTHTKAGTPMGILCTLSEHDGAVPGAARAYERKIQELATRAELQQSIQQDRIAVNS